MKTGSIWFLCGLILGVIMTLIITKPLCNKHIDVGVVYSDTIVDTIRYYPEIYDSVVVRYVTQTLPIRKDTTIYNVTYVDSLSNDSASVVIPITQKHYAESTYDAWVSGFQPSLDSIRLYMPTITNTKYIKENGKRFSIGITTGYGLSEHGLSPYIGVGVTYSLLKF